MYNSTLGGDRTHGQSVKSRTLSQTELQRHYDLSSCNVLFFKKKKRKKKKTKGYSCSHISKDYPRWFLDVHFHGPAITLLHEITRAVMNISIVE